MTTPDLSISVPTALVAVLFCVAVLLAVAMRHVLLKSRMLAEQYRGARDVAENARAELLTVIETIPMAFVLVDRDGNLRLQNKTATDLLGPAPSGANAMEDLSPPVHAHLA